MAKQLIIFDCDGVLVDSEPASNLVISENLNKHGLAVTPEKCMELFVGGTIRGVFEKAKCLGADLPDDWIDEIYSKIYDRLRQGIDPVAGVATLLNSLNKKNIEFCVASNGSEEKMNITLGGTGLLHYFEGKMYSAHSVGIAKPEPGLFQHAAEKMGYASSQCSVIEDSASGIKAAIAADMKCFGYNEHSDFEMISKLGATPFDDMANLSNLLNI